MPSVDPKKTLKKTINDTIKELSKKITQLDDELLQADIYQQIGSLLSQRALLQQRVLTEPSTTLNDAINSLNELAAEAKAAKKDVDKIEKMLLKTSRTVDKVTQFIGTLAKLA